MRDLDDLDARLSRHLDVMADHVDVGDSDLDAIPHRATRQRRSRAAVRGGGACAGIALLAGVFVMAGSDEESPVDTVDESELDAGPDNDRETGAEERRPVEVTPFEATTPMVTGAVEAFGENFGLRIRPGTTGGQADALARSSNGIDWETIDDVPVEGFAGMTGREDLLAVASNRTDSVAIAAFDGDEWVESTLPVPAGAQLQSLASSPTHVLALVQVPTQDEVEWRARRAQAEAELEDRFGDYDSFSKGSSADGVTYYLYNGGAVLFEGTAEETGLDPGLLEAMFERPDQEPAELLLYRSKSGASWSQGVPPTAVVGVDPVQLAASDSDIGMTVTIAGGFAYTPDGESWTTVALDGVSAEDHVDVQHGPGYVIAATARMVARADAITGPYETVTTVDDPNTFLTTAVGERGVVTVTSTTRNSEDGIDSAAEAESLGLDGDTYLGPTFEHQVLASADGRTLEPLKIDTTLHRFLVPHVAARDGWIIVRDQQASPESMSLGNGFRVDPGG